MALGFIVAFCRAVEEEEASEKRLGPPPETGEFQETQKGSSVKFDLWQFFIVTLDYTLYL